MRVYIAGPMSGIKDMNFPAFHAAAAELRAMGHEVVSPAELNPDPGKPWAECMKVDIAQLVTCEAVILLDGWAKSRGALIECRLAQKLKIRVLPMCSVQRIGEPA